MHNNLNGVYNAGNVDVSIIIPCFNQGIYLSDAISSVNALRDDDSFTLEVIIVNDGSNDKQTLDLLNSLSGETNCQIINQTNQGLSSARNAGLLAAAGKFIQFLDADDILVNNKFKYQLQSFSDDPELGVCVSDFLYSKENLNIRFTLPTHKVKLDSCYPVDDFLFRWERGFTLPIHCAMFNRDLCFKHKYEIFDIDQRSKEDWLMWCNLAMSGVKFKFTPMVMAIYRTHEASMTRNVQDSLLGFIMAEAKISSLITDSTLKNKFLQQCSMHIASYYLPVYIDNLDLKSLFNLIKHKIIVRLSLWKLLFKQLLFGAK